MFLRNLLSSNPKTHNSQLIQHFVGVAGIVALEAVGLAFQHLACHAVLVATAVEGASQMQFLQCGIACGGVVCAGHYGGAGFGIVQHGVVSDARHRE